MVKYKSLKEISTPGDHPKERPNRRKLLKLSLVSILVVLGCILLLNILAPNAVDEEQLLFVGVLHRHGARMGLHKFTFENFTWPLHLGALTEKGMQQGFDFGKQLRYAYWPQLSGGDMKVDMMTIDGMSTNTSRTIDTAHSVLLGLFSEDDVSVTKNCSCRPDRGGKPSSLDCLGQCLGLESVPPDIPVEVEVLNTSDIQSSLLIQYAVCNEYLAWNKAWKSSDEYMSAENSTFKGQAERVKEIAGNETVCSESQLKDDGMLEVKSECSNITLRVIEEVWGNAVCAESAGIPYPSQNSISKHTVADLHKAVEWLWHNEYPKEMGPNSGGILLGDIVKRMTDVVTSRMKHNNRKMGHMTGPVSGTSMILYSAHDSTVASLLAALGLENWHLPEFLSHVVFELWGPTCPCQQENTRVKIKYDDSAIGVSGCPKAGCSLKDFRSAVSGRTRTMQDCKFVSIV